jgi:mono/diheme cytochrome c family protein
MKTRFLLFAKCMLLAGVLAIPGAVWAQQGTGQETKVASNNDPAPAGATTSRAAAAQPTPAKQEDEDALRLEGEKRFHDNCGRCHQAPHKLPPRMMATAIRHMRVRATITDEDMRVILHYMTQ